MRLLILLTAVLPIFGCSSIPQKMTEIHRGMSRSEVVDVLGDPDSAGGTKTSDIIYYNPVVSFGTHALYFVEFESDSVTRYGQVPTAQPNPAALMVLQNSMNQQQTSPQQNAFVRPQTAPIRCTSNSAGGTTFTNCN